jgi:hypothetical protein
MIWSFWLLIAVTVEVKILDECPTVVTGTVSKGLDLQSCTGVVIIEDRVFKLIQ